MKQTENKNREKRKLHLRASLHPEKCENHNAQRNKRLRNRGWNDNYFEVSGCKCNAVSKGKTEAQKTQVTKSFLNKK
jgi:hypothetical protein